MRVNLGCSDGHLAGWLNVDIAEPADQIVDLSKPWPWADSSIDFLRAWDIFEHLPDIILTMNEAWRVLKPNAQLELVIPTTDGRGAWQDPTHKSWWNRNSFFYFTDGDSHRERFGKSYGIVARFTILSEKTQQLADEVTRLSINLRAKK